MRVKVGSTDVTTYFHLRLAADGTDATGLTISNVDMQYTRSGVAPTAKVDAVALAATDTAHTDNRGIEIDATDQPGLYRFDWPDAAFAAGVREVLLSIKVATAFTETLRVELDVNTAEDVYTRIGAPAGASVSADIADLPTNAELATSQAAADDATLSAIAALNNLSAAQVNAEVLDVMNVDTFAEPGQATPGATTTLQLKLAYLYKAWRNKTTQTATQYSLYNDDTTTLAQKATFSDDATTATRGEVATGP